MRWRQSQLIEFWNLSDLYVSVLDENRRQTCKEESDISVMTYTDEFNHITSSRGSLSLGGMIIELLNVYICSCRSCISVYIMFNR